MMQTTYQISDKKVFNQMFKSLRVNGFKAMQGCTWDEVKDSESYVFYTQSDRENFDEDGYLKDTIYLDFSGDGNAIQRLVQDFGYRTDWNGDNHYKMGVMPVAEKELDAR